VVDPFDSEDTMALDNYWGQTSTEEILSGPNPRNLTAIYDYYDNVELNQSVYCNPEPDGTCPDIPTTAFPMPRVTAPRWGYEFDQLDTITFNGYGYDYEDAAAAGCEDPVNAVAGMWVSTDNEYSCSDADHDHWSCHRCPLDGPEHCPASCYLDDSNLVWCRTEDDCAGANLLGTGSAVDVAASELGAGTQRIWLWAYDSNGQVGKVPTEVVVQ